MKRKQPTEDQYTFWAAKLRSIQGDLVHLEVEIANAFGSSKKRERSLTKIIEHLSEYRTFLEQEAWQHGLEVEF
jgi:hypothetical protein